MCACLLYSIAFLFFIIHHGNNRSYVFDLIDPFTYFYYNWFSKGNNWKRCTLNISHPPAFGSEV